MQESWAKSRLQTSFGRDAFVGTDLLVRFFRYLAFRPGFSSFHSRWTRFGLKGANSDRRGIQACRYPVPGRAISDRRSFSLAFRSGFR